MPESDREFTKTIINFCDNIFYHYLQMNLMRMKLSFFAPQGITSSASKPEIFRKHYFHDFFPEKGAEFYFCSMLHLKLAILTKASI